MSLLSYTDLHAILKAGVLENAVPENINSASIDIRLGRHILIEDMTEAWKYSQHPQVLSLKNRDKLNTLSHDLVNEGSFTLQPGQFILAQSFEVFHLPNNISAEYKLKSSMARIGLEHLNAGWCDAGWNGSVLTLELRNLTAHHPIRLEYLDSIGQMVFYRHKLVPAEGSYATRGRYNQDRKVQGVKK